MIKLTEDQIKQKKQFIRDYINSSNSANGSKMDANANVDNQNIATLEAELNKDINIQVNRSLIKDKIELLFDKDTSDKYIEMLENHEIYTNDESSLKPYCVSLSMYPFLLNGLTELGGESKAPTHLESFCGSFVNLVFAISSQFAGAIATVEFLMNFDYFSRKDYGENYLETNKDIINNHLQHVVYALNQPASARNYQSVFWNLSIFDKYYFKSIFDNFVYPDGSKPCWKTIDILQKHFMKWFNVERTKAVLTFPVITFAGLTDGKTFKDVDYGDFICNELAEGNSFFLFLDKNAHSLSSCCFGADQKCLTKSSNGVNYISFKELSDSNFKDKKRNLTIFHNGSWVKGREVKLPSREMYEIITSNNKKIILSDNHINPTFKGEIETKDLNIDDYLLFNTNELNTYPEKDEYLSFEQGYVVGAFLGNGSFGTRHKKYENMIYDINFSMNINSYVEAMKNIDKVSVSNACLSSPYNNVYPVRVSDKILVSFIQRWINWKEGTKAYNKELNLDCLLQSKKFREGILHGWYATDGGNSNRCYTTSSKLAETMEVLITSLGMNSIIDISDKTNEEVLIRGECYNRNYPLYCVRWYDAKNKRSMKDVYKVKNNSIYFKIKSIRKIDYDEDNIYCFEMQNEDEPFFTLPNGLITHNCRLRNDISDQINEFSYSLGAGGVMTGSLNVITMNLNRIVQNAHNNGKDIFEEIKYYTQMIHKFQFAFKSLFEDYLKAELLPVYDAGYISMNKQFLTVGINGLIESAEFMGYKISNNKAYKLYAENIMKTISDENKKGRLIYDCKFNTELIPAENVGVKHAKWDKEDGYQVNRDCYNSYMYKVEDDDISIIDKIILHGKQFMKYLDGGSALHANLMNYPTTEGFRKILNIAIMEGCNYLCFNIKVTICNDCNYIDKRTLLKCSKCGSKNIDYGTRIIGYLKRISAYSTPRQLEEGIRIYK